MASLFANMFSTEDIDYILALPEVIAALSKLTTTTGRVYFTIPLTETIRTALSTRLGLDLSNVSEIPMRWIQGDTLPHVDAGSKAFENTYLVYLNDCPGELVVDTNSYPITANTGVIFSEGLSHKTLNTGIAPRLLVGPMNEFAGPVGSPAVYFPTENDALTGNYGSAVYVSGNYVIPSLPGYSSWRIASNSSGSSPQNIVYNVGDVLNSDGSYNLFPQPSAVCFVEGTRVLTQNGYKPIEKLLQKDLIVTSDARTVDYVLKKIPFPVTDKASAPYRIEAGAFGANKPSTDICLSPTHKIQLRKGVWISPERAALTNPKVKQYGIGEPVNYWHIACDDYLKDNLICEGLVVESLATNKNYNGPSKVYTWNDRLGGFTRPASSKAKTMSK
jgi:hypothetical protein